MRSVGGTSYGGRAAVGTLFDDLRQAKRRKISYIAFTFIYFVKGPSWSLVGMNQQRMNFIDRHIELSGKSTAHQIYLMYVKSLCGEAS